MSGNIGKSALTDRELVSGVEDPVLRLRPGVEWQHVDEEVVALDLNSSVYLAVNDTGALLWPLLAEGTTEPRLVEELTTRFSVHPDRARADVGAFVERLRSLTLVEEG